LHFTRRDVVECAPSVAIILHLADVMQTHVPFVSGPMKCVREPTSLVVPFKHQHALACVYPQQDCHCEPADAGADHDGIPCIRQLCLLVRYSARRYHKLSHPFKARSTFEFTAVPARQSSAA
jgi:hypothetical protein